MQSVLFRNQLKCAVTVSHSGEFFDALAVCELWRTNSVTQVPAVCDLSRPRGVFFLCSTRCLAIVAHTGDLYFALCGRETKSDSQSKSALTVLFLPNKILWPWRAVSSWTKAMCFLNK